MDFTQGLKNEERTAFALRGIYEHHGYKKVRVSKFEDYSLYIDNKNFLKTENIITFMDLDGKLLALRPDVTLSIVKNTPSEPCACFEKLYYNEKVYRLAKHNHAYKEISQIGLECIGNIDECAMIEVLGLAADSLASVGGQFILAVSHMGFWGGALEALGIKSDYYPSVMQCIKQKNGTELLRILKNLGINNEYTEKISKISRLSGDFDSVLEQAQGLVLNDTMNEALNELKYLYSAFCGTKNGESLRLDFSVVNDLDYYNGIIFQGYIEDVPRAVLLGGRYDKLLRKLGKNKGAVGFAMYIDELEHYYKCEAKTDADLLIIYDTIDDYKAFSALIKTYYDMGQRVRIERAVPQGFKCSNILYYKDGALVKGDY
ncbi:MAG: ATP phosphoribosyltransferase regulatory subunit [Hydrogenoanaerobacterium sp.]